jgi:alkylation response protein AidB-like acyl-CoA dehydrogenase
MNRRDEAAMSDAQQSPGGDASAVGARLIAEIDALAPEIIATAIEAETEGRIPPSITERLVAAGLYRASVPQSHGGLELDLPTMAMIIRRLSRLDASVGWVASVRMLLPFGLALLPRERYDAVLRGGPDIALNASNQPGGRAELTPEGLRVSGRWPFASGCEDSDWMALNCVLTRDGQPVPGPVPGAPAMRMVLVPRRDIRIEDTWRALGLKATASHHVVVDGAVVPEADAVDPAIAKSCVSGPLYGRVMQIAPLLHCPIALGIAEGALNDLVAVAKSGVRQLGSVSLLQDSEAFRLQLGEAQAEWRAAQALADAEIHRVWNEASMGALENAPQPDIGQAAAWITQACLRVTQKCFELGGASAVYEISSLQRRLRDLLAAAQHTLVQRRQYIPAARSLLQ